jgi:hypothetical protein
MREPFFSQYFTGQVKFTVQSAKGSYTFTIDVDVSKNAAGDMIPKLACKSMIRDLQERRSYLHNFDGSLKPENSENLVRDEIIQLSLK